MINFLYRYIHFILLSFQFLVALFLASPGIASDVYIKTDDNEVGQGILRQRGTECLVVTPLHVIENAFKIDVTLADKRKFSAEMIESFPGDISVLRITQNDSMRCKNNNSFNDTQLDTLLEAEKHGELRTMLADGSIRIIPVNIVGYDKFRNIHVTPQDATVYFAKGESGSPLYIAGYFSGVLLSVKNNIGNILRSDALTQTVSLFFNDKSKSNNQNISSQKSEVTAERPAKKQAPSIDQEFSGFIANSAAIEHRIKLEGNSPVRLSFSPTGDTEHFNVEILDSARRIVFQNKKTTLSGSDSVKIPFTPPSNDIYSIFILGTKGEGKYTFKVTPITSNARLRDASNALHIGGNAVHEIIAQGAVAEYHVQLAENSPIRLHFPATDDQVRYCLDILDATGKSVYQDRNKQYSATDSVNIPFTPPKNGAYLIRIKGTEGEGKFSLQLLPIASNSQLRSVANVLSIGETAVEGIIAQGAVAEYRIHLEAGHPVRFKFSASGDLGQYNVEVVDSTGVAVYINPSKRYSGTETFVIPFTAPKIGTYILRILGGEGESRYALNVQNGGRT